MDNKLMVILPSVISVISAIGIILFNIFYFGGKFTQFKNLLYNFVASFIKTREDTALILDILIKGNLVGEEIKKQHQISAQAERENLLRLLKELGVKANPISDNSKICGTISKRLPI